MELPADIALPLPHAHALTDSRYLTHEGRPLILSAFVARTRECVGELIAPMAVLIVVIESSKEIASGAEEITYAAGDTFVLPAGAPASDRIGRISDRPRRTAKPPPLYPPLMSKREGALP